MIIRTLLDQAESAGVELLAEGTSLRFRCPAGALSAELRQLLTEHKADILDHFQLDRDQALTLLERGKVLRPGLMLFDFYADQIRQHFATGNVVMVAHGVDGARRILADLAPRPSTCPATAATFSEPKWGGQIT
jgi:hypothetical protein